ncbi:hypothetical protein C7999DRAFT_39219 [Corynascus novoguineensis]|uniref:SPX domain-containing protein n=1 Tax=Corynascus novoguineensis TaxID=1126955 RepID=A0AAN7HH67_9PEZI|nr:hypothetical protein C7999DRAFT_39219 [Corynascus novoguineensis]
MKYGEHFERESVPQWSLHNIDYNSLKHYIKAHTTKDQATAIAIPGHPNTALTKFEDDFYAELCRQHDRVDLFVSSKADEISRRLQHLSTQIHRLILRCATSGHEPMPLKRRQRFAKYEHTLLQCGDDIKALRRFVNAQYRKWTGSVALGTRFRENILSHHKSFTKRDFTQLQSQYDDLLQTLRAALPAGGIALPDSEPGAQTSLVTTEPQPPTGYWNEYECGSEAGDFDRNGDEYAIYIDPNEDTGFPGLKAVGRFLAKPLHKLSAWISFQPKHDLLNADAERESLLRGQAGAAGYYGSTCITPPELSYFSSSPPGGYTNTHSTGTAAGTDTDLDDQRTSSSHRGSVSRGYTSASSLSDEPASSLMFPPGYRAHYAAALPSIADQRVARYRERVLRWATGACFATAFVLMGIAAMLVAAGRHKMRLEVDAGRTSSKLATWFPHAQHPIIISAPMLGTSNATLAVEVSKAGGIGFILCHDTFAAHFERTVVPLLLRHRPAAVWLFAPRPEDVAEGAADSAVARVITRLRREGFGAMVQVGTVAAARAAVVQASEGGGADVLVVQGADAGGHQFAGGGAGIISLFIASEEAWTPEFRKKLILEATDGGPSTVKTSVLDDIQGTAIWPSIFDGRGLVGKSWQDHMAGMPLEENIRLFKEADQAGNTSRKITWAGTGVGLVRQVKPAGEIVKEVREDALRRIRSLASGA